MTDCSSLLLMEWGQKAGAKLFFSGFLCGRGGPYSSNWFGRFVGSPFSDGQRRTVYFLVSVKHYISTCTCDLSLMLPT